MRVNLALAGLLACIAEKMEIDIDQTMKDLVRKFDEHDLL